AAESNTDARCLIGTRGGERLVLFGSNGEASRMRTLPNVLVSLVAVLFCSSASADNKSIQGTVIGTNGKPLPGAEVRVDRTDAKSAAALAKTDAKGHYVVKALPAGVYSVIAFVNGVPRSRAAVKTQTTGWAEV